MSSIEIGSAELGLHADAHGFTDEMNRAADVAAKSAQSIAASAKALSSKTESELAKVGSYFSKLSEAAIAGTLAVTKAYKLSSIALSEYSGAITTSGTVTEALVNTYRGLRIALSPTPFTVATVAVGILTEETIKLTMARAKLIEQQVLIAAITGTPIQNVERLNLTSQISGGDPTKLQSVSSNLASRNSSGASRNGLEAMGLSSDDPDLLLKIAKGFDSIEDPAKRAAVAVQLFGAAHADEALQTLNLKFIDSAEAVKKYGIVLNSTARTEIFQFRQDILRMKEALTDVSAIKVWAADFETMMAEMAAAWQMSKNGASAFDAFLDKWTHLKGALAPVLKLDISDAAKKNDASSNYQQGLTADELYAQTQGAKDRQSQTLEGRQAAQAAQQAKADEAYKKIQADEQTKKDNGPDAGLDGKARLQLVNQQQSAQTQATNIGTQVKALKDAAEAADTASKDAEATSKVRLQNALAAIPQQADAQRKAVELQITLDHKAALEKIASIVDPHARSIAMADEDVKVAQDKLSKLKPILDAELQARIAVINKQAALEGTGSAHETAKGSIASLRSSTSGSIADMQGGIKTAEADAQTARMTAAREYSEAWTDVLAKELDEIERNGRASQEAISKNVSELLAAQSKAAGTQDKGAGEVNALSIDRQKIVLENQYALQLSHTNEQQVTFLNRIAALEEKSRQAKIAGLQLDESHLDPDDPSKLDERAKIESDIAKLKGESANAQLVAANNILTVLQDQNNLLQAQKSLQTTLQNWNNINSGTGAQDLVNAGSQVPGAVGGALSSAIFTRPQGGESKATEIGKAVADAMKNIGKNLLGELITQAIEKLIAELGFQLTGQAAAIVAQNANTVALAANTAAQVASGTASAAGGVAGGVGSAAGGVASGVGSAVSGAATGLAGPLISAAGGIIGGVISAVTTWIGDNKIVKAINGTTAAVQSLGAHMGSVGASTATTTSSTGSTTATSSSSGIPIVGGLLQSIFGFGGGSGSQPIPVNVVSINPLAPISGFFKMFGFADGGFPPVGVPSWVGERGRELFVPRTAGMIIPNHVLSGLQMPSDSSMSMMHSSSMSSGGGGGSTHHYRIIPRRRFTSMKRLTLRGLLES